MTKSEMRRLLIENSTYDTFLVMEMNAEELKAALIEEGIINEMKKINE